MASIDKLAPGSVEPACRWVAIIFMAALGDCLIPASPRIWIARPNKLGTR